VLFVLLSCFDTDAQTPFLGFPLSGYTPYNAPISSVFDHTLTSRRGYDVDQQVAAYTGERGYRSQISQCYAQLNNEPFTINGNYQGTYSTGRSIRLCYDGHPGLDYVVGAGTLVYATGAGWVVGRENNCVEGNRTCGSGGSGNYVKIDHGNGYQTLYLHLSTGSVKVSLNQYVSQGQELGAVGATGNVSGPHLHFEVRKKVPELNDWISVDPYGWEGNSFDPRTIVDSVNLWLDTYRLYDEGLASGWEDWSWGMDGLTNFCFSSDPARIRTDSCSLRVKYIADWAGLYLHSYSGVYTGGKNALTFAVQFDGRFNLGARNLVVQLYNISGYWLGEVNIVDYIRGGPIAPDIWYQVVIPLANIGAHYTTVTDILIMSPMGTPRVYFDDIQFR
jgi:murein DD-endopeptidase MepM/ murein hydrolase activator NlpD